MIKEELKDRYPKEKKERKERVVKGNLGNRQSICSHIHEGFNEGGKQPTVLPLWENVGYQGLIYFNCIK